jgi:signal transduction histidine kinase
MSLSDRVLAAICRLQPLSAPELPAIAAAIEATIGGAFVLTLDGESRPAGASDEGRAAAARTEAGRSGEWIHAPIRAGERIVGGLACALPGADPADLGPVEALAGTIGLRIAAERRFAEHQQRGTELNALRRVAETLGDTLDLSIVLQRCLDIAEEMLGADSASLHLIDEAARSIDLAAWRHLPPESIEYARTLPFVPQTPMGQESRRTHRPVYIRREDPNLSARARLAFDHAKTAVAVSVPLTFGERSVGILSLGFQTERQLPDSTLETLMAIAEQEAIAIDRARVHELAGLRARLAGHLRDVAEKMIAAGNDSQAIIDGLLDGVTRICRSPMARFITFDGSGHARTLAARGYPPELLSVIERIPDDDAYRRQVDVAHEPHIVSSREQLPESSTARAIMDAGLFASLISLPLRHGARVLGHLSCPSREPRRFRPEEIEAMRVLQSIGAAALENERLRRNAEIEHRRLGQVVDRLPFPIAVIGASLSYESSNAAYRELTGLSVPRGTAYFDHIRQLGLTGLDGQILRDEDLVVRRALDGEEPEPKVATFRGTQGAKICQAVAMPLRDPSGAVTAALLALTDITEMRELAEEKDRFLAIASHELRSPIASLTACLELLEIDPSSITDPTRRDQLLGRVRNQVNRLCRLVDDLIDTARLRADALPIEREEMDLVAVAREAVDLALLQPKHHQMRLDAPEPVRGHWDRHRMTQVATNLVANAVRYSPDGGEIVVGVHYLGDEARLTVSDQGIGIGPTLLRRVFEPFVRGREADGRAPRGLGLGLFITREIVRRHGGQITVESEPGAGARFSVTLPIRPR